MKTINLLKTAIAACLGSLVLITPIVYAGPNDFFGGNAPGGDASMGLPSPAGQPQAPGDLTDDEKQMRKKFKANLKHANQLVAKGEAMMKAGTKKKNDKTFKKGKILKEIGEKRIAELNEKNPLTTELDLATEARDAAKDPNDKKAMKKAAKEAKRQADEAKKQAKIAAKAAKKKAGEKPAANAATDTTSPAN